MKKPERGSSERQLGMTPPQKLEMSAYYDCRTTFEADCEKIRLGYPVAENAYSDARTAAVSHGEAIVVARGGDGIL